MYSSGARVTDAEEKAEELALKSAEPEVMNFGCCAYN